MRAILSLFLFGSLHLTALAQNERMVIEGKYQLRNLYVVGGTSAEGVGNCIVEVNVNDRVTSDEIADSGFEIDLSVHGLKLGDDVVIEIVHRASCSPRVLNSGALQPEPTFNIVSIVLKEPNVLEWSTANEQGELPFIVQQKKWNKWVNVGEVMGKGTSGQNTYQFEVRPVSGPNQFRVIQKGYDGGIRKSPVAIYQSPVQKVDYAYDKKAQRISFSSATSYELYNQYGQIVKRGYGKEVDVTGIQRGEYILTYDNSMAEFTR